ncbi:hypothetical protein VaNZ11_013491 [Volvox africanus]|uniref:Uncharacterized protein n=1 Tax=Volvox africanus TaxID=51714 RepID=A0ABQ5SHM1_9CHLO|nr:hypothetical protein VaNZ11_013491 [Volvox africanus]
MEWGREVLGCTLILSSPLAACYGTKLLARLGLELEETRRVFSLRQSLASCAGLRARGPEAQNENAERSQEFTGENCFQYNNAAFVCQSCDDYGADTAECEDSEELDFCILTPQQALGALGEHAPQYAKIFLNGYTFVADRSEPGTVMSVDEYADRMHVSAASRRHSAGGSCLATSSVTESQTCGAASPGFTPGRSPNDQLSTCSDSSSLRCRSSCARDFSTSAPTFSERSSFELSLLSYQSSLGLARTTLESDTYYDTMPHTYPVLQNGFDLDATQAHVEQGMTAAAEAMTQEVQVQHRTGRNDCAAPVTPREFAGPQRPVLSPFTDSGACHAETSPSSPVDTWRSGGRAQCAGVHGAEHVGGVKAYQGSGCSSSQSRSVGALHKCAAPGGTLGAAEQKGSKRPWVPSGVRLVPSPLLQTPAPRASVPLSSSHTSRMAVNVKKDANTACSWEAASAPHSPLQPTCSRSCGSRSVGGSPSSIAISPAGLCTAPALPLPDGTTLESAVPPALRYYLAQTRAAGNQDVQGVEAGRRAPEMAARCQSSGCDSTGQGVGSADISAGQPGFVRATVEQLNTQRLVCCHVTPYAAAKTCRKPRPLVQRVPVSKSEVLLNYG